MSKRQWLMLFGVWIMIFLFLGFPAAGNKIIAIATGFFVLVGAYRMRDHSPVSSSERQVPYVEHRREAPEMGGGTGQKNITNSYQS